MNTPHSPSHGEFARDDHSLSETHIPSEPTPTEATSTPSPNRKPNCPSCGGSLALVCWVGHSVQMACRSCGALTTVHPKGYEPAGK